MSVSVALERLQHHVDAAPSGPFLITVGDDGPHLTSVAARWDGERLAVPVGRTSAGNAATRPAVTLLWPTADQDGYSLIVDGDATVVTSADGSASLQVAPRKAVLHRLAEVPADDERPSCVTILPA